jgi:hypothetical protein
VQPKTQSAVAFPFILIATTAAAQPAEPLFVVRNAASAGASDDTVGMRLDRLFAPQAIACC